MSFEFGDRVQRTDTGSYALRLPKEERALLHDLHGQLRDLLLGGTRDPAVARLFPPAFAESEVERNAEYRRLMGDELLAQRLNALDALESTIDSDTIDEEHLGAWLGCLNDLRLVLGTRLDITEEDTGDVANDDPRAPAYALYYYLSWLVEQIVDALSGGL